MLLLRLLIWIYSRHANYKHMALWKINFSINAIRNTNLHTYKHTKMTLYLLISNAKWLLCQYCFPTCMLNCTWCANRSGPLITARLQSQTCSEPIVYIHVQRTLRRPYTRQHVACNSMNFSNLVASNPLIYWNLPIFIWVACNISKTRRYTHCSWLVLPSAIVPAPPRNLVPPQRHLVHNWWPLNMPPFTFACTSRQMQSWCPPGYGLSQTKVPPTLSPEWYCPIRAHTLSSNDVNWTTRTKTHHHMSK